jgi:hypothetical protein
MPFHNVLKFAQLGPAEPSARMQTDWIEPELGRMAVALDMHVWWLGVITRVEKKPTLACPQHSRH